MISREGDATRTIAVRLWQSIHVHLYPLEANMASFARDRNYDRSGVEFHPYNSSRVSHAKEGRLHLKRRLAKLNRRRHDAAIMDQIHTA